MQQWACANSQVRFFEPFTSGDCLVPRGIPYKQKPNLKAEPTPVDATTKGDGTSDSIRLWNVNGCGHRV